MELTNEQWKRIEPIIVSSTPSKDPRGRPARDPREVLNEFMANNSARELVGYDALVGISAISPRHPTRNF